MNLIEKYAFRWFLMRVLLLLLGFIIYITSCPIEIHPWILGAIAIFSLLEPLIILLIALLTENTKKF